MRPVCQQWEMWLLQLKSTQRVKENERKDVPPPTKKEDEKTPETDLNRNDNKLFT